jgi:hypothetical protein
MGDNERQELIYILGLLEGMSTGLMSREMVIKAELSNYLLKLNYIKDNLRKIISGHSLEIEENVEPADSNSSEQM